MRNLITLIAATCVCTSVLASGPIEKIEQQFPKNIGEFLLLKRTLVPAETNRVTFQYKVPDRANATLTITALNPTRDSVDIEATFRKSMADYARSESTRIVSKLPDFPGSLIGQGCGPQFQQLSFKSKGRVTSFINNNFATVFERHLIRISVVHMENSTNHQLEIQFLNHIRAALGDCK
jgi:hypothetical protein